MNADDDDEDVVDDDGDGDGSGDGDDERKMMMRMFRRRRRKMLMLRGMMLRRKTGPETRKHTLCEPAQSKCTWTLHQGKVADAKNP